MWPHRPPGVRGSPSRPGDYATNDAGWTSPDSFTVYIDLGDNPQRHARIRGTVRGGVFAVDTVAVGAP